MRLRRRGIKPIAAEVCGNMCSQPVTLPTRSLAHMMMRDARWSRSATAVRARALATDHSNRFPFMPYAEVDRAHKTPIACSCLSMCVRLRPIGSHSTPRRWQTNVISGFGSQLLVCELTWSAELGSIGVATACLCTHSRVHPIRQVFRMLIFACFFSVQQATREKQN